MHGSKPEVMVFYPLVIRTPMVDVPNVIHQIKEDKNRKYLAKRKLKLVKLIQIYKKEMYILFLYFH